ncbi:unnamed protein product [Caenorhabditis brenneri]
MNSIPDKKEKDGWTAVLKLADEVLSPLSKNGTPLEDAIFDNLSEDQKQAPIPDKELVSIGVDGDMWDVALGFKAFEVVVNGSENEK